MLRISANNLLMKNFLEVTATGIVWVESVGIGGRRSFRFDQIDAVLRGDRIVAFQVGREIFSIAHDPQNAQHRTAIARLVSEAKRTVRKV